MQNYTRDAPSHLVNICRHFRQCENDRYRKGVISKDSSHIGFIPFRPQTVQQIQCSNFTEQIYSVWGCAVFTTIICMSVCYIELIGLKFGVEGVNFELNKFLDFSSPYVRRDYLHKIWPEETQCRQNVSSSSSFSFSSSSSSFSSRNIFCSRSRKCVILTLRAVCGSYRAGAPRALQ